MDTLDLTGAAVGEVRQGIAQVRTVPEVIYLNLDQPLAAVVQRALARKLRHGRATASQEALELCRFLHDALPEAVRTPLMRSMADGARHRA